MKEYIEREALIAEYDRVHKGAPGGARKLMIDAPAADVEKVRHGEWKTDKYDIQYPLFGAYYHTCNKCAYTYCDVRNFGYNYCPGCGAKMDGARMDGVTEIYVGHKGGKK